jgi:hypothetical protein
MRKLLADAQHAANWNWRAAGREELLLATMERLSGQFDMTQKSAQPFQNTNAPY